MCYSYGLFATPDNLIFSPTSDTEVFCKEYDLQNTIITTGGLMQKFIEMGLIKLYGYNYVEYWESVVKCILEQNPSEKKVEFHFYCQDEHLAYYFKGERNEDIIDFSIMVGYELDMKYHEEVYDDDDDDDNNFYSQFIFNSMKYKEVYPFCMKDRNSELDYWSYY